MKVHKKVEKRGRPKIIDNEIKPDIFERVYEDFEVRSVWKYNLNISRNGPISTEHFHKVEGPVVIEDDYLPKTQRKYINPQNGKEVGYTRAKNLGII